MTTTELGALAFPLNVYAMAVAFEEGEVHAMHFGLDWSAGPIAVAQERATDYLLNRLPPPPLQVLEIGIGFGTLAHRLSALGYVYRGISPDAEQIKLARRRYPDLEFDCLAFQDLAQRDEHDIVVFQESAQYIDTPDIVRIGREILRSGGCMIVADEIPADMLRTISTLPRETGFTVREIDDVSARASGTLDYLIEAIYRHRFDILEAAGLPSRRLTGLLNTLEQRREDYRSGAYRYVFARFDRL